MTSGWRIPLGIAPLLGATFFVHSELHAQPVAVRTFASAPSCTSCTIVLTELLQFQLPDSLSFSTSARAVRLPSGAFLVVGEGKGALNETPVPALLDASGRFVRIIARSGQGPGEITVGRSAVVGPGDSVWVFDGGPSRHVFSPDVRYVRRDQFPLGRSLLALNDGQFVLASARGNSATAGYPLHFIDRNGIVGRSFGIDNPTIDPRRLSADRDDVQSYLTRDVVDGAGGTFWVHGALRFLLEQYDYSGRLLYRGQHALDGWYKDASEKKPGMGAFKGAALARISHQT